MHQPSTEPRRSLYYRYRVFPAFQPSSTLQRQGERRKVVIVGAGPIGLAAALDLARFGVPCVVLESERQVCDGSRAIVFTRRSLEILQQVGVAERICEKGLPWRFGNSFYRGERVFRLEAPYDEDDRFFPMINLQQQYVEDYLVDAISREPRIELRWGNRVTGLAQTDAGASLDVDTPGGPYRMDADWVVAADGARSTVRQLLGLKMEGDAYEGRFVIADIRIDIDLPTERLAFFDPSWNPGNTVLMHRQPGDLWRIDYQLPPGEEPEQALAAESLCTRIAAQLDMIGMGHLPWELDWSSVYSARTMTLPQYVHGRVAFTGDAAHLLPIFGVRGANTGWQDSNNLAWKLACVVNGWSSPSLLQTYSQERVTAAREIIDEAGKSTRFMTPPSRGFRLLRDATLSLSLQHAFVRPLFHWRTSRPHEYLHSALNAADDDDGLFRAGPVKGAAVPNIRLGQHRHLLDRFGPAFHFLHFTEGGEVPAAIRNTLASLRTIGMPLQVIAIRRQGEGSVYGADVTVTDASGHAWQKYGIESAGAAYLVRPDQHVCARWLAPTPAKLAAAFHRALAHDTVAVPAS